MPGIPQPTSDPQSLFVTVEMLQEAVELLQGQRGSPDDCAVTWGDLVRLGVIREDQVPTDVGADRLR